VERSLSEGMRMFCGGFAPPVLFYDKETTSELISAC